MTIPLLNRGRAKRASSAEIHARSQKSFPLHRTLKFRNPLPHPARTAVLCGRLTGNNVKSFHSKDTEAIQTFRPGILAGTFLNLFEVAAKLQALKAIVLFSKLPASPEIRDWLWNRFQVPCFEQLLDRTGQVVAEECEVHSGLHVLNTQAVTGSLSSTECDCGRTEPKLHTAVK